MQIVKIEDRRDYELYVKREVAKMQVSNKNKAAIRLIAMHCFDSGIAFNQNNLTVEIAL